jgi:transcriptional regulator with XRE-family HTH domain
MDELDRAGRALARVRRHLGFTMEDAKTAALKAVDEGVPQAEIARRLGVDRMTVRKWLGKRREDTP